MGIPRMSVIDRPALADGSPRPPDRPAGTHMVVRFKPRPGATMFAPGVRFFEVLDDQDPDGEYARIAPLAMTDYRTPLWVATANLEEVPGAHVNADGWLLIPTNQSDA